MNELGELIVQATQNRGFSAEELARAATDRIIYVGDKSHPVIRDQAQAFKTHIQAVLTDTLKQAIAQDRITIAHRMHAAGHGALVELLRD